MNDIIPWENFTQFGLVGLMLAVLLAITITGVWMVKSIVRELSQDRNNAEDRWRETFVVVSERSDQRTKETNDVLRDLSGTIKVIEGLVKK